MTRLTFVNGDKFGIGRELIPNKETRRYSSDGRCLSRWIKSFRIIKLIVNDRIRFDETIRWEIDEGK